VTSAVQQSLSLQWGFGRSWHANPDGHFINCSLQARSLALLDLDLSNAFCPGNLAIRRS
jgi:hypothetical protein